MRAFFCLLILTGAKDSWPKVHRAFWSAVSFNFGIRSRCFSNMLSRVHQKSKKISKYHGLLIYFVPTWVQAISAKKMIFFAFSSLGHHVEKNGPCSRENGVKISKKRFLAIKSCRNMLQPSSQHCPCWHKTHQEATRLQKPLGSLVHPNV